MRDRSRINIGDVFNRWRHLREFKAFKTDEDLAKFLLDRTGATMREVIELQNLQDISEEDTLYDIVLPEAPHDDPVSIPDNCKVAVSGDIVGQQAAIVYHKSINHCTKLIPESSG
uniref:Uncharacterized protein n=1 Tax=Knipowitschia caucasica TaxID=637954 RepID=A0AAV2LU74_KNICA